MVVLGGGAVSYERGTPVAGETLNSRFGRPITWVLRSYETPTLLGHHRSLGIGPL